MDVPPIDARPWGKGKVLLSCLALECDWSEVATDNGPELIAEHQKWHEDGMPE